MYAIVEIGSMQFKVSEGDTIQAPSFKEDVGQDVTLDKVLLFAKGADVRIGQPFLSDVKVTAKVSKHDRADKITSLKYRRRKNSARKVCHRQGITELNITKIAA